MVFSGISPISNSDPYIRITDAMDACISIFLTDHFMIYSTFVVFIQNSEAEYYLHPIQMYNVSGRIYFGNARSYDAGSSVASGFAVRKF